MKYKLQSGFGEVKPTLHLSRRYTGSEARPIDLPKDDKQHSRRLCPAWIQNKISSTTQTRTSSIVFTHLSNVLLFLSFHSIQQVKTTKESKEPRTSFWILFLAATHQSASVCSCAVGATTSHPTVRSKRYQISLEKGQATSKWSIVSEDWEHKAHESSSCRR